MRDTHTAGVVLAPGYGGSAKQPILRALEKRLEPAGIACLAISFSTKGARPSRGYEIELADLRAAREALRARCGGPIALVGRSFGGRMCALLAAAEPPEALAILGHPIAPPGRPRPGDEAALAAVTCSTLVVQGERDELGPMAVLQRIAQANPRMEIEVIAGAGHDFGRRTDEVVDITVRWLQRTLMGR